MAVGPVRVFNFVDEIAVEYANASPRCRPRHNVIPAELSPFRVPRIFHSALSSGPLNARPRKPDVFCSQASSDNVDAARPYHPFKTMVAIFASASTRFVKV